ncbi:MAG: aminoacyl-tRNA hydrolase, partial [Nocardioidaceae bacterium]|nr:aminoacyl-tRNA hydrolase [Nocardioidaceae bacterium]
ITITSSQYKSQHRNREAAKVRLEALVTNSLVPAKSRHKSKPSRAARQRRLDDKKRRGTDKALRRRPD